MARSVKIGERVLAAGEPCLVIAEAGVNHNGRVELAAQLIDAAIAAHADAVKFQTWITENQVSPTAALASYQRVGGAKS